MKNTFKLVLINAVACAAVLNDCGYTHQFQNMGFNNMNMNAAPAFGNNNMMNMPKNSINNNMVMNMPNNNFNTWNMDMQKCNATMQDMKANPQKWLYCLSKQHDYINSCYNNINGFNTALNNMISRNRTHTIGLQNIGATCYLNATLQAIIAAFPEEFAIKLLKHIRDNYATLF